MPLFELGVSGHYIQDEGDKLSQKLLPYHIFIPEICFIALLLISEFSLYAQKSHENIDLLYIPRRAIGTRKGC